MNFDEVLKKIPVYIASFYNSIYALNVSKNIFFNIEYNGTELVVDEQQTMIEADLKFSVFKENVAEFVKSNKPAKHIVHTKDNKEMIFIVDPEEELTFVYVMQMVTNTNVEKKCLIIADDSPIITKFFNKIFCDEFDILVATNGQELIDMINNNQTENVVGVFLDLSMPIMSGYDVLEYFKQNNLFGTYPVAIISGEDTPDGIEKALNYTGVVDMLKKPFTAEAARAIVNKTISFSNKMK